MLGFRLTKFHPEFRLENNAYTLDDWTSISDIGCVYSGRNFTLKDYLKAEDAYVESVHRFLTAASVVTLKITNRELKDDPCDHLPLSMRAEAKFKVLQLAKKRILAGQEIEWVVRLCLRECFWCRLESESGVYVHFGYDYQMYVGIEEESFKMPRLPPGMHAELFDSPWHRE